MASSPPPRGPLDPLFRADALDLAAFIAASPSPFHCVAEAARRLDAAGFTRVEERAPWEGGAPGPGYVVRGGALVAWAGRPAPTAGYRIVGAHTDSPNLRLKPRPDTGSAGFRQLGVEVYGGALWNSWLDRDLGLSGRVTTAAPDEPGGVRTRLLRVDRALARIPQLAIHLDRGVNDGLKLNPQQHLVPVWGTGVAHEGDLLDFVAGELGLEASHVLAFDLMFHDTGAPALLGQDHELLSAARIDNQLSCWAAVTALLDAAAEPGDGPAPVACLFDFEEVGSETATGASGPLLATVLERLLPAGTRDDYHQALAASVCVSADGAHATHPNYPERHEPNHWIAVNGGPVIKQNANARYATDAESSARFRLAATAAGVPVQEFVVRSDLPCGSTIGPLTATRLGIPVVDVGVAQLSMHSARELCGSWDPRWFRQALGAFLAA